MANKNLKATNASLMEQLRALQSGEVDALIIRGPLGDRVSTLQSAEQPYRELVEALNEGVVTISKDGIILYCNAKFQLMTNVPAEKLVGSDIRAHVRPESRHALEFFMKRSRISATTIEILLHVENKVPLNILLSASPIRLPDKDGLCFVVTDISGMKQTEVNHQATDYLSRLINNLPIPLILLEDELKGYTFVNARAKNILLGADPQISSQNQSEDEFSITFLKNDGDSYGLSELLEQLRTYPAGFETRLLCKNRKRPVLLFGVDFPALYGRKSCKLLMFQDMSAVKQAQLDLLQALHGRDQFMSALSHELRTPLNAILGWVEILRAHPHEPHLLDQALNTLERNANLQRDLIEDLLDMSRIVTGNLVLQKKPLDIKKATLETLNELKAKADEKSIELKFHFDQDLAIIAADEKRIQQLIFNLVQNAIKFTPTHGQVELRVQTEKDLGRVVIEVKDNGQGIDREFLPYVFDQFKQENMSTSRAYGGLGLGLAISKTIVAQHGGEITAHSEGTGKGATFTVKLPLSLQPRMNASALSVMNSGRAVDLGGVRVLVVDDSKDNLALFSIWLKNSGAEIQTMESATGIVEKISQFKPDVLLSDISMPGEDGYALIAKVRSLPAQSGGRVPAGAITANARTEDRDMSIAAGFHMHIPKPITAFCLVKAVKSLSQMSKSLGN